MGRWNVIDNWKQSMKGICNGIKIRCPRNFVLLPGREAYKTIRNPRINIDDANIKWLKKNLGIEVRNYTYQRDANGNKIDNRNPKDFYHPLVTPGYALEHIYDPENPICKIQCRHSCVRKVGGNVNIGLIKRLKPEEKPTWQIHT